jgi:hypothetical protein
VAPLLLLCSRLACAHEAASGVALPFWQRKNGQHCCPPVMSHSSSNRGLDNRGLSNRETKQQHYRVWQLCIAMCAFCRMSNLQTFTAAATHPSANQTHRHVDQVAQGLDRRACRWNNRLPLAPARHARCNPKQLYSQLIQSESWRQTNCATKLPLAAHTAAHKLCANCHSKPLYTSRTARQPCMHDCAVHAWLSPLS